MNMTKAKYFVASWHHGGQEVKIVMSNGYTHFQAYRFARHIMRVEPTASVDVIAAYNAPDIRGPLMTWLAGLELMRDPNT
jgi:hypothetical protein